MQEVLHNGSLKSLIH